MDSLIQHLCKNDAELKNTDCPTSFALSETFIQDLRSGILNIKKENNDHCMILGDEIREEHTPDKMEMGSLEDLDRLNTLFTIHQRLYGCFLFSNLSSAEAEWIVRKVWCKRVSLTYRTDGGNKVFKYPVSGFVKCREHFDTSVEACSTGLHGTVFDNLACFFAYGQRVLFFRIPLGYTDHHGKWIWNKLVASWNHRDAKFCKFRVQGVWVLSSHVCKV